MEVNRDEAERCKSIASKALVQGQYDKAVKFLKKSLSLYPLPGVEALLSTAERCAADKDGSGGPRENGNGSARPNPSSTSSSAAASSSPPSSANARSNDHSTSSNTTTSRPAATMRRTESNASESGRSYTQAQVDIVERILKAKDSGRGAHYRVLEVSENCTEADLKKSYRKIALKVHPDKNSSPKADEAFKAVGLAFATLSDSQKRAIYDRYGDEDPDNRGGGGMRHAGGGGGVHFRPGEEVSPEDIFRMFFGGMPGGPGMGGGGVHRGPGGVHFYSNFGGPGGFGGAQQQRRRGAGAGQQQQQADAVPGLANLFQLLPVLLFVVLSFMNMSSSSTQGGTSSTGRSPGLNRYFSLTNKDQFVNPLYTKLTKVKDIPYFVDNSFLRTLYRDRYQLAQVERMVENAYENYLVEECNQQRKQKRALLTEAEKQPTPEEKEIAKRTAQQFDLARCIELNDLFPLRHTGRPR